MAETFNMNKFSLTGKVALVTGASYGIGFAIASGYASAGATIIFNDINQDLVNKGLSLIHIFKQINNGLTPICLKISFKELGVRPEAIAILIPALSAFFKASIFCRDIDLSSQAKVPSTSMHSNLYFILLTKLKYPYLIILKLLR